MELRFLLHRIEGSVTSLLVRDDGGFELAGEVRVQRVPDVRAVQR